MEGDKDHWNEPSTSKAAQYEQIENEDQGSGTSINRDTLQSDIVLSENRNESSNRNKKEVAVQDPKTPPTSPPKKDPGESNEPVKGNENRSDHLEQNIPSRSKAIENKVDSQNVETGTVGIGQAISELKAVETSLADIFWEMTGAVCDSHDNHSHSRDEMTSCCQRKNYFYSIPLFDGFLDMLEKEKETEGTTEDAVEDEGPIENKAESSYRPDSQPACCFFQQISEPKSDDTGDEFLTTKSKSDDTVANISSPQPSSEVVENTDSVPTSPVSLKEAETEPQNPQNSEDEMLKFMNEISSPSPFIQQQKSELLKRKKHEYNEKVAMKIFEQMILSSMNTVNTRPQGTPGPSLNPQKVDSLTQKVEELEKRLKQIDREMRESEREKKYLLSQVNHLEVLALEMKKIKLMKQFVSTEEPSEDDIEVLDQLKGLIKYQEDSTKELKELERQNKIMEKVLSEAENSLSFAPWFHREGMAPSAATTKEPAKPPRVKKKLRFNQNVTVVTFDNREFPIKVPRWNSQNVETVHIHPGDTYESRISSFVDDADLMEEKMEEIRRKKEEEKFVKVTSFVEEEELEEEGSQHGSSVSLK